MSLLELFCAVDDCREAFESTWQQQLLTSGAWRRRPLFGHERFRPPPAAKAIALRPRNNARRES